MKKEACYMAVCYMANLAALIGLCFMVTLVTDLDMEVGLWITSAIVAMFTTCASILVFWAWLKIEVVVFVTKDVQTSQEFD